MVNTPERRTSDPMEITAEAYGELVKKNVPTEMIVQLFESRVSRTIELTDTSAEPKLLRENLLADYRETVEKSLSWGYEVEIKERLGAYDLGKNDVIRFRFRNPEGERTVFFIVDDVIPVINHEHLHEGMDESEIGHRLLCHIYVPKSSASPEEYENANVALPIFIGGKRNLEARYDDLNERTASLLKENLIASCSVFHGRGVSKTSTEAVGGDSWPIPSSEGRRSE